MGSSLSLCPLRVSEALRSGRFGDSDVMEIASGKGWGLYFQERGVLQSPYVSPDAFPATARQP